jgi:hypothetical protein
MHDLERRRYNMLVRVRDYIVANLADFAGNAIVTENLSLLNLVIGELEASLAKQSSGVTKLHTGNKASARSELRSTLRLFNITAQSIAVDNPSIIETFRMPRGDNDGQLLAKARSFLTEASPIKGQFVAFGLTASQFDKLENDITIFETATAEQGKSLTNRVGATATIDNSIDNGLKSVKRMNAVVQNRYADNPAKLAEWTSASHIEKTPKKKPETPPTP